MHPSAAKSWLLRGKAGGHDRGEIALIIGLIAARRRIPDGRGRSLDADEHVGAAVLDRLKLADRSAELLATWRAPPRSRDTTLRPPRTPPQARSTPGSATP